MRQGLQAFSVRHAVYTCAYMFEADTTPTRNPKREEGGESIKRKKGADVVALLLRDVLLAHPSCRPSHFRNINRCATS